MKNLLMVLMIVASLLFVKSTYAQPLCYGLDPTIVGTPDDVIYGTSGPDVIVGLAGNDEINGLGGDDVICGGEGRDLIRGGDGNDYLFGGRRADILRGDAGNDILRGGRGNDVHNGGSGSDKCLDKFGNNTYSNCEKYNQCPCNFFAVPMSVRCWERGSDETVFYQFPTPGNSSGFDSCSLLKSNGMRDGILVWTRDYWGYGGQTGCYISGLNSDRCSAPEVYYGELSQSIVDDCVKNLEEYTTAINNAGISVIGGPPYTCIPDDTVAGDPCYGCWDY